MKILLCFLVNFSFVLANIEDYRVSTWNLQGASANTESKWNVSVRQLLTGDNLANIPYGARGWVDSYFSN